MYQILPKLSIKLTLAFYFVMLKIHIKTFSYMTFFTQGKKKLTPNTARSLENYFWNHIKCFYINYS